MTKQSIGFVVSLLAASVGCSSADLGDEARALDPSGEGPVGAVGGPSAAAQALYPSGPYGSGVGAVVANTSFLGWRDPAAAGYDPGRLEVVSFSDFYNPGGDTSDVKLILLNASAVWCTVCRTEYRHFQDEQIYATYRARGVEMIGVIFEDNDFRPAKPSDLELWGGTRGFTVPFPLVLDPGLKTGIYFTSDATPLNLLIDARSMRIIDATMGYDPSEGSGSYWDRIDRWLAEN